MDLSKGEITREKIIDSAHALFVSQGYHGTSMRQIALNANIALGGIYNHFANKEELFREVFYAYHPSRELLPILAAMEETTIEDLIRSGARKMIKALEARPDFLNLMFIEYVEFNNQHSKQLADVVVPNGTKLVSHLADAHVKLRDIPLPVVIRAFIGFFFSFYLTKVITQDWADGKMNTADLEYFITIFLHGVLKTVDG